MAKFDSANRFRLTPTNRHIHNNIDAPYVFLPYQIYGGFVPYDGDVNGILESILPQGWKVVYNGTGDYSIVHNLGTLVYSFVANATQSTNQIVTPVVSTFTDELQVIWFDSAGAEQDTSFNFILLVLENNTANFPTYDTNNTTPRFS